MVGTELIVLDLDETLIHSCSEWIGRKYDFIAANHMIFVRPFAREFVALLLERYKVGVWTASYGEYTNTILSEVFADPAALEFAWDRGQCDLRSLDNGHEYFSKELAKLHAAGWLENDYRIVDDRPEHIVGDERHVMPIKPYYGSTDDVELISLAKTLGLPCPAGGGTDVQI